MKWFRAFMRTADPHLHNFIVTYRRFDYPDEMEVFERCECGINRYALYTCGRLVTTGLVPWGYLND